MSARLVVFIVVVTTLGTTRASRADKLYVTEYSHFTSPVVRMDLDGSMQEELLASVSSRFAQAIVVDSRNAKLYLLALLSGVSGIYRANLDGSALRLVLPDDIDPDDFISDFAVDTRSEKVYWVGLFEGSIYSVDASGGMPEVVHLDADARDVAIDPDREQMYWMDFRENMIFRSHVTGDDIEVVAIGPESSGSATGGLELDLVRRQVYWFYSDGSIVRASMDGGEVQTFRRENGILTDIAIDAPRGHLYWTMLGGRIVRANLDGTERTVIASDLADNGFTAGIALYLECGNGRVDPGETCDVAIEPGWTGECVTECFDSDPCSSDEVTGFGTCSARCEFETITELVDRDGCCPNDSFTLVDDSDCTLRPFPDVPAVSSWGAVLLSLLLVVGITLKWRRRQAATPHAR